MTVVPRSVLRNGLARVVTSVAWLLPKSGHIVVVGSPPEEGNAVEVARALSRRGGARIYWVDRPSVEYLRGLGFESPDEIQPLAGGLSVRTLLVYARASVIFFTHGTYGCPAPGRNQTVVNLWHGEPVKNGRLFPHRTLRRPPANYVSGSSRLLTARKAELAGMAPSSALLTGNPRTDQFMRPPSADSLRVLGVDPTRPFVVWLPTFRVAQAEDGSIAWSNTTDTAADAELTSSLDATIKALAEAGIQLITKPHRLDYQDRSSSETVLVTDADLEQVGIGLYQLLGASAGLITDYSSVWVDYLQLDRPIGFHIPDIHGFSAGRGFYPSWIMETLPGIVLDTRTAIHDFISDIQDPSASKHAAARAEAMRRLGVSAATGRAAEDLLNALEHRPSLRKRPKRRKPPRS